MSGFVHLHLHSEFSLLDGACRIDEIASSAENSGHSAVALTDHGNLFGAVAFWCACRNHGVKPIIGCELSVAPRSISDRSPSDLLDSHLVLLCKNETGYKNLMQLVSRSFTDGFYTKPRVDDDLLTTYSDGLIALSGCSHGRIQSALTAGDYDSAKRAAENYVSIFGRENFYIEIQDHGLIEQRQIRPQLKRLADELNLQLVATNDCHYIRRGDADAQAVLMSIRNNTVVSDGRPRGFENNELYYKSTEEMAALFADLPSAVSNTEVIAERCNLEFDFSHTHLPTFRCPDGRDPVVYLTSLAKRGLDERIASGDIDFSSGSPEDYRKRLSYELSVIINMGFADYFLIVQDYVNFAKSKDIPVGPGRGSGAGSLVAYCIGITDVDPLRFGLLFERFLNPERVSMPDFDVDFCYTRRQEVLDYVVRRYGQDHVSQIITFGTLAAKAAIRDVGRALGMPYQVVDRVAKLIPRELNITLEKAMAGRELRELYESSPEVRRLIDTARPLEGMPRNISIHAAGVVITERPVSEYVPLAVSNGVVVTQFDMDTVAKLGLLKFDFLALRYLTILNDAAVQIKENDKNFDLGKLPLDDRETYALISAGNTSGVFQLESAGMRSMLTELRPDCIEDILAAIALYRPGPMDSIPKFIEGRRDRSKIKYPSPLLEPVLSETFGCTVYQEQVMSIFRILAGYTYGHADIVRRAMAKKKASVLEAERGDFVAGAVKNGMSEADAEALFDDMGSFANYAFNKSHAAAYAVIAYRTAYLKAHYPREYFAAMLTSVLGDPIKIAEYVSECGKVGIRVLPPDINESDTYFHVCEGGIRFGLLALKNVGHQFVEAIICERASRPFASFRDFVERMSDRELNKRMIESLIKAGCFDRLGVSRSRLAAGYEPMINMINERSRSNLSGQLDMFSGPAKSSGPVFEYPKVREYTLREKLMYEKECSGMYLTGHLIDGFSRAVEAENAAPIAKLLADPADRERVKVCGIVGAVNPKTTKNGDNMMFFRLEDRFAEIECVLFPNKYDEYSYFVHIDEALCVVGTLALRDDEPPRLNVNSIMPLEDNQHFRPESAAAAQPAQTTQAAQPTGATRGDRGSAPARDPKAAPNGQGTDNRPTASAGYDPYSVAGKPSTDTPTAANTTPRTPTAKPGKLYIRVPSMSSIEFRKCENLAEIFPGETGIVYYDGSCGKYMSRGGGIMLDKFIMSVITSYVGEGNAVVK